MAEPTDNAPEISVSELSNALKRTVEDRFGFVRVRGEVSGWRGPHSSGHVYFCLKDQNARIDAVIWKGAYQRLRVKPEEGMEVIATGKITTYPGKSTYQIVVDSIEPAGVGALLAQLEERRRRLAAEGLFDDARKQLLPFLPRVVGVITSPTGAVIRDILHRVADRFPLRVIVWPVRVQGETSGAEVARAIEGFNALPEGGKIPRPDVLIVARGGGSLEDLWGFNEEVVVRAAAGSLIPLVSAVGHETDWTLIDHASDKRAPTPTAAAEICVPVRSDLLGQVAALARRQLGAAARLGERRRADLRSLARALPGPEDLLATPRQRIDRAGELLASRLAAGLRERALKVGRLGALVARHSPHAELVRRSERLSALDKRLSAALAARLRAERAQAVSTQARLEVLGERMRQALRVGVDRRRRDLAGVEKLRASFDHRNVLKRGFALVRRAEDKTLVRSAAGVDTGLGVLVEFADGAFAATVTGEGASPPPVAAPSPRPRAEKAAARRQGDTKQGSLF